MTEFNIGNATTTGFDSLTDLDYTVDPKTLDSPTGIGESSWQNKNFSEYMGYYTTIPEFKKAIDALSTWTAGKGWTANANTTVILEHISGNGKQCFQTIMEAHQSMKKINGDAYTQIIRSDKGTLINFKLLNPSRLKTVYTKEGIIDRYDYYDVSRKKLIHKFKPEEILHSMNEPIGDEIHGKSAVEACKWIILARNEAMEDWKRILHRSTIRVLVVPVDQPEELKLVKTQYETGIKNGDVLILPGKPGEAMFQDLTAPPIQVFLEWIRYLEDFFYKAVGIPKIILGGSSEYTEASSKVGYITFDPVYSQEQLELEADLWNQAGIRVKFNRPAELGGLMTQSEEKNTGQTGFQPNEVQPTIGRNE